MEALLSATQLGGQVMMMGGELGMIRDGFLADLLLVDGDPLSDIKILQQPERILAVMKDGRFYKEPEIRTSRSRLSLTAA
jgi:imidazolonepropionase-like amidohydrolase